MTDIKSTPATIARALGWDFDQNASLEALAAWEAYREIPLNTGTYTDERDAFTSGFDAATKTAPDKLAAQITRTADALEAMVAVNKTAARIAWVTRPGGSPGPAVREWIDGELGL